MAENLSSSQILQWTNDVTNNIGKVVNTADSIRDTIEAIEKFTKGKNVDESILKVLSSLKTTMQRTITGINKQSKTFSEQLTSFVNDSLGNTDKTSSELNESLTTLNTKLRNLINGSTSAAKK